MTASLSTSHRPGEVRSADHRTLERAGLHPLPPLPARPPLHLVSPEGQLQVHTAPYRGSFASVLSQALRAAGLGSRVMVVQFLKGGVAQGPDRRLPFVDDSSGCGLMLLAVWPSPLRNRSQTPWLQFRPSGLSAVPSS